MAAGAEVEAAAAAIAAAAVEFLQRLQQVGENVFVDNLVGNHYPDRPQNLDKVCLHDFVANYTANGKDKSGHKT